MVETKAVHVLGTVVASVVVGLVIVNAQRGEWGMSAAGVVLVVGIGITLAALQLPTRR
jgi:hypothetical protein